MGTINPNVSGDWTTYGGTSVVPSMHATGYQNANFVAQSYPFNVQSNTYAISVRLRFGRSWNGTTSSVPLVCQIANNSESFINANGPQGSSRGRATFTASPYGDYTLTFTYPIDLSTGNLYYLWIYPDGTSANDLLDLYSPSIETAEGAYIDLNGRLDGIDSGNISGYGTCDVYINGSKVGTSRTDWWTWYPLGTTYSFQNIIPTTGHEYKGVVDSVPISGTVTTTNKNINVRMIFDIISYTITANSGTDFVTVTGGGTYTYGSSVTLTATVGSKTGATTSFDGWYNSSSTRVSTSLSYTFTATSNVTYTAKGTYTWNNYYLDLNGLLDGTSSGGISGYGTCDVYINGTKVATGVSDYYQQHTYGSSYQFTNIQPTLGSTYVGVSSGSLTGTIEASTTTVVLQFKKNSNIIRIPYINNSNTYKTYITYVYENGAWVCRSVHVF